MEDRVRLVRGLEVGVVGVQAAITDGELAELARNLVISLVENLC